MKISRTKTLPQAGVLALLALWVVAGCARTPAAMDGAREHVGRHKEAVLLFEQGRYSACVRAFGEWLQRYESMDADLGASARFYRALSYKHLGSTTKAKEAFRKMCARYAWVPETEPAAKWRHWAEQELRDLDK